MTDSDVEFGVFLITFGDIATPDAFRAVATEAERLGYEAVCVGDHVAIPEHVPDTYPFSETGEAPFDVTQDAYDAFQVLAHVGAVTDTIALGTNTTIAPYRHPVTLTKHVLTLDNLTDGRFELGVAPGWMETEFEVLDVPFPERGSRTDEFLAVLEQAFEASTFSFEGPHHSFQPTGFRPRPVRTDGIPVWIGGFSGASFRRTAEFGDGWTIFPDTPSEVAEGVDRLGEAWSAHDRSGNPEIAAALTDIDLGVEDGTLVGDVPAMTDRIRDYVAAGANRVYLFPQAMARSTDDHLVGLRLLQDEVLGEV